MADGKGLKWWTERVVLVGGVLAVGAGASYLFERVRFVEAPDVAAAEPRPVGTGNVDPVALEAAPAAEPTLAQRILEFSGIATAIEFANESAKGTGEARYYETSLLMGYWLAERGSWQDVGVEHDETSLKRAHKDIDAAVGKRLCVRGRISQIARDRDISPYTQRPVFRGILVSNQMEAVSYVAVGDSGELVGGSAARLCGAVVDLRSYDNASGGTTHSVAMAGMFDLPTNRGPQR